MVWIGVSNRAGRFQRALRNQSGYRSALADTGRAKKLPISCQGLPRMRHEELECVPWAPSTFRMSRQGR